ncbi:MAG: 4'-phosphopantetheinyl transferase superfamily protein [Candidatus Eisenbacteria bacterium]|nr:4'-phosphopantetheinyl transferase superfamily protein [Candidatus Eisenbacteria bacterium]MCC7142790.1 4'-phosphopantetheinyl transferase superfamily protein [Candidatus Eisenbacteria bacterium]
MARWASIEVPAGGPEGNFPSLGRDEVHLWRIALAVDQVQRERFHSLLSPDERDRREGYRFDLHRDRFTVRRGALRLLLGAYTGIDPASLRFELSPHQRPELDAAHGVPSLAWNLTDSDDLALLAVTRDAGVGVDLESVRGIAELEALVASHFSPAEQAEFAALPAESRLTAFYLGWTRKEAWLKAQGVGLGGDLQGFSVTLSPRRPARLLWVAGDPAARMRWRFHIVAPAPGAVAAVVVERRPSRLRCFDLR